MPETNLAELLSPATLARIDNYALLARLAVEGFISGLHRSLYHGFGSEFFQYRSYVPGDDLKYVDWKVYGRQDKFYTKVFQEETNMNCCVLLDASASMAYQGRRAACSKLQYGCMIGASLAYLASRQGDNVGLYAYSDELLASVPPGRRTGGLQRLMTELQRLQPSGVADHESALNLVGEKFRRRGLVIYISDMHGLEDSLARHIKRFRFAHHDCIVFQVLDDDELDLPFHRTTRFVDSENAAQTATAPDIIRDGYQRDMEAFTDAIRNACLSERADYLLARTSDNLGNLLAAYLHRREALH
jgi:uncharacterized protein (DUF58 family)